MLSLIDVATLVVYLPRILGAGLAMSQRAASKGLDSYCSGQTSVLHNRLCLGQARGLAIGVSVMLRPVAREMAAEFLGTLVLIVFGCAAVAQVVLSRL